MNNINKIKKAREALLETEFRAFTNALFTLFDNLEDVGDDTVSFSDGNLGFNLSANEIEIVDIAKSEAIITLKIQ